MQNVATLEWRQATLYEPSILGPVSHRDPSVTISGVPRGSSVRVWLARNIEAPNYETVYLLGTIVTTEPIVSVDLSWPDPDMVDMNVVWADASWRGDLWKSGKLLTVEDPCSILYYDFERSFVRLEENFWVEPSDTGGGYFTPIIGELYAPVGGQLNSPKRPLVIIAHGHSGGAPSLAYSVNSIYTTNSYLGYHYIAEHLARCGIYVYSLDLDLVNRKMSQDTDGSGDHQQEARAQIILKAADLILKNPVYRDRLDCNRIGLLGHSMSGEAVIWAQNRAWHWGFNNFNINGVVSFAPADRNLDLTLCDPADFQISGHCDVKYLHIVGSHDDFFHTGFANQHYDHAKSEKSHVYIYGGTHSAFNTIWEEGNTYQRDVARCFINAFFIHAFDLDVRGGSTQYVGYLQSTVLPQSVRQHRVFLQHRTTPEKVVPIPLDMGTARRVSVEYKSSFTNNHDTSAFQFVWNYLSWRVLRWFIPSPHYLRIFDEPIGAIGANGENLKFLSLRVAQDTTTEQAMRIYTGPDLDFSVELGDGTNRAVIRVGSIASVPFPDKTLGRGGHDPRLITMLRTVRLPLNAFKADNPLLNLSMIRHMRLLFNISPKGAIYITDMEFVP